MVKYISLLRLKPGVDPDETYKLWREEHAPWAKAKLLPEARKYTINRVIHTIGEVDIYGFPEFVFDDLESAKRALGRGLSTTPDKFMAECTTSLGRIIVQEEEIEL